MSALSPFITEAEYWELEACAEVRHEYFNGRRRRRPECGHVHARISTNATAGLGVRLRGQPYYALGSLQRIKVAATGLQTYPDVSVYGPGAEFEGMGSEALLNPVIIVEVLSPSTQDYDRGDKFEHYKLIPTLTDYLLVAQKRIWVEHYARADGGWLRRDYWKREDIIPLPSIEVELPMDELYEGLDLPAGLFELPTAP